MSSEPLAHRGRSYHDIHIGGNARVLMGDVLGSEFTERADFVGQYAHSSLRPVTNYVPRPDLQRKIRAQLPAIGDADSSESRTVVVWGLGGSGKSQLVLNYVREYRQEYGAIYRLLYPERVTGSGGLVSAAEDTVPAVKSWFQRQKGRCLFVLDSADSLDDVEDPSYIDVNYYVPDTPRLDTIITTRSSQAEALSSSEAVEVRDMAVNEAVELFRKCAKLAQPNHETEVEIRKIVDELSHLALAITLAGSYVAVTPRVKSNIRLYLPEYREHRQRLLSRKAIHNIHRYNESVLSTWEISFAAVERQSKVAVSLLRLLAFLNLDDIFPNLFSIQASLDGTTDNSGHTQSLRWLSMMSSETAVDQYDIESSFATLQKYSLVSWRADQRADQGVYTMHKLVHAWAHDRLGMKQRQTWSLAALELLRGVVEEYRGDVAMETRLVPHLMANFTAMSTACKLLSDLADRDQESVAMVGHFLHRLGLWAYEHDVRAFLVRVTQQELGIEHPTALRSMNNLAMVLSLERKHEQAVVMHQRTLEASERVLGREHQITLVSMSNLGSALRGQGKYKQSEEQHRQALDLKERVLGKEHPDTLVTMNNIALVLGDRGKYVAAEKMHQQTLELMKRVKGAAHPSTMVSMNNLGLVLRNLGKYEQAEQLYRWALYIVETKLGNKHPSTLTTMNNFALVLSDQGKYEVAKDIQQKVLKSREEVLGKEHPETLQSMSNLANAMNGQGNYRQAEEMIRHTLESMEATLGKEHPALLTSTTTLASILGHQGKHEQSENLFRRTLGVQQRVLGNEHPQTLESMCKLAVQLLYLGKQDQAEEMHRRTLELMMTVSGSKHPSTLRCMGVLADILYRQKKHKEAEELCRRTLALSETVLAREHPTTMASMNSLGRMLQSQGKYSEATKLQQELLQLRIIQLGADHPDVYQTYHDLAITMNGQKRYDGAKELIQKAINGREKLLGPEHQLTLVSTHSHASILALEGRDTANDQLLDDSDALMRETLLKRQATLDVTHNDITTSKIGLTTVLKMKAKLCKDRGKPDTA